MVSNPNYFKGGNIRKITLKTKGNIAYSDKELEDMFAEDEFIKKMEQTNE